MTMTECDIVARLRGRVHDAQMDHEQMMDDAADEIERLRTDYQEAKASDRLHYAEMVHLASEVDRLKAALESLTKDPPASLAREPDPDWEVIIKMRNIAREAIGRPPSEPYCYVCGGPAHDALACYRNVEQGASGGWEDGDQSGSHAGSRHKDNPRR